MDTRVKEIQDQAVDLQSEVKSELEKITKTTLENTQKLSQTVEQLQQNQTSSLKELESKIHGNVTYNSSLMFRLDSTIYFHA
jgi:Sec-independent protein translocase protein TatA